jgi:6-phosphofructokinase 1
MVLEVMGRDAGFIALHSGVAGAADVILIPELPYYLDRVCKVVTDRQAAGKMYTLIVAAEGAFPAGGTQFKRRASLPGSAPRLGGIGEQLAAQIQDETGKEARAMVLGHLQRGGMPTGYDRLLATRFGGAAVRAIADGLWGHMVALQTPHIVTIPIAEALREHKRVDPTHDVVLTARATGISFGE